MLEQIFDNLIDRLQFYQCRIYHTNACQSERERQEEREKRNKFSINYTVVISDYSTDVLTHVCFAVYNLHVLSHLLILKL